MSKTLSDCALLVGAAEYEGQRLLEDLRAIEKQDRDLYPGEWFGLARRLVTYRRAIALHGAARQPTNQVAKSRSLALGGRMGLR